MGKSIFLFKHLGKGYKITFALNTSVSSFSFSQNLYCLYSSLGSDEILCADYFVLTNLEQRSPMSPRKTWRHEGPLLAGYVSTYDLDGS